MSTLSALRSTTFSRTSLRERCPSCESSRDQPTLHPIYRRRTRRTNGWKTHDYFRNGRSTRLQLSNQGGLLDGRVRPLPSSTAHRSPWRPLRICYLQGAFLVGRWKRRTGPGDNHWRLGDWDPGLHAIQGPGRPTHQTTNQDCRHWIRHRTMVVALPRVSERIPRRLRPSSPTRIGPG